MGCIASKKQVDVICHEKNHDFDEAVQVEDTYFVARQFSSNNEVDVVNTACTTQLTTTESIVTLDIASQRNEPTLTTQISKSISRNSPDAACQVISKRYPNPFQTQIYSNNTKCNQFCTQSQSRHIFNCISLSGKLTKSFPQLSR